MRLHAARSAQTETARKFREIIAFIGSETARLATRLPSLINKVFPKPSSRQFRKILNLKRVGLYFTNFRQLNWRMLRRTNALSTVLLIVENCFAQGTMKRNATNSQIQKIDRILRKQLWPAAQNKAKVLSLG